MKSIIFDFNGTLFQDTEIHFKSWQIYLGRLGRSITMEYYLANMCGPVNEDIFGRLFNHTLSDEEIQIMSRDKERVYREVVLSDPAYCHLTPGADEALDRLKAAGVPIAIATGSIRDNVDFYFEALGIGRWFDYDHVFYAVKDLPGKPDPALYHLAMEKLGFVPENTLVVEDSMPGVRSAIAAGVDHVIAIDTSLGADSFESIPQVQAVIHDFRGFAELIERLYPTNNKEEAQ